VWGAGAGTAAGTARVPFAAPPFTLPVVPQPGSTGAVPVAPGPNQWYVVPTIRDGSPTGPAGTPPDNPTGNNGNYGDNDKKEQKENPNEYLPCLMPRSDTGGGFYHRLYRAIGLTYNLNSVFQVRPEIGYYRNWNVPAFDNGARQNQVLYGFDMTYRF
jgi:hypothetical protein